MSRRFRGCLSERIEARRILMTIKEILGARQEPDILSKCSHASCHMAMKFSGRPKTASKSRSWASMWMVMTVSVRYRPIQLPYVLFESPKGMKVGRVVKLLRQVSGSPARTTRLLAFALLGLNM